jgi:hypothetical protein
MLKSLIEGLLALLDTVNPGQILTARSGDKQFHASDKPS